MSTELFTIPPCDSPQLAWMKKTGIVTTDFGASGECPETGSYKRWHCERPGVEDEMFGEGDTRDEAIAEWAKANKVRLWNEEGL